uniref:apolipoprotein L3-like isoform X3 n=1 Tax=Myodes glareolus TaxID=447135 RepID=UPI002020D4A6|nr:apolipoprotein L3-like isoform X3 [Myodes glareolus]
MGSPERKGFIMSVIEYLWDTRNTETLQLLPTKEEFGIQLVERAGLSSFSPFNLMLAVGLLFMAYMIYRKQSTSLREAPGEMVADPDVENADEYESPNDLQDKTGREKETSLREPPGEMVADPDIEKDADDGKLQNDLQDQTEETSLCEAPGEMVADPDIEKDADDGKLQNDLQDQTERKEEDALHEAHKETTVDSNGEDKDDIQNALQKKKRFLEVYPQVKLELEERITKLHALADKIDKVHRDCTITQVVASSTSAVSGVLTILGLTLAPVTAGVSLGLSATGLGLGAAAAVTSVSTTIVEKVSTKSKEDKARQVLTTSKNTVKGIKEVVEKNTLRISSPFVNSTQNLEVIKNSINAGQLAKSKHSLATNTKHLMTTGRVSSQSITQVEKAFGSTALAITKGARIVGAATAGLFLVLDVVNLVNDSKHLQEGAKAESAAKLRQQAQDLEQKLQELIRVHDSLTQ